MTTKGRVAPLIERFHPEYFSIEAYPAGQSAPFCKVADQWGIFSNFARTPIVFDGMRFNCAEQLFQCLKFTSSDALRDLLAASGQTIKMKARKFEKEGLLRDDWGAVIIDAMKLCLSLKYEQSHDFRQALERSRGLYIVEDQTSFPRKSADTWGCKLIGDSFVGPNLLGRLLMELRDSHSAFAKSINSQTINNLNIMSNSVNNTLMNILNNYDSAYDLGNGYYSVTKGDESMIIYQDGKIVVGPDIKHERDRAWEYVILEKDGKFGFLDEETGIVCPPRFDDIEKPEDDNRMIRVRQGDTWGYVDEALNFYDEDDDDFGLDKDGNQLCFL